MDSLDTATKKDIFKKIASVVDSYLYDGANISGIKRYFRHNSSLANLILDINGVGEGKFENKEDYKYELENLLDRLNTIKSKYKNLKNIQNEINIINIKLKDLEV